MLKLRFLTGPRAGQTIDLQPGDYTVGRSKQNGICVPTASVSKTHARLTVQNDKCIVTDLESSNGTYVNGAKVHDRIVIPGDRVAFHDVVIELFWEAYPTWPIQQGPDANNVNSPVKFPPIPMQQQMMHGNLAMPLPPTPQMGINPQMMPPVPPAQQLKGLADFVKAYVNNVVLPGIYKINEVYPLKSIVAGFILIYVVVLTVLSMTPMLSMNSAGIQKEASRRALSLAKQLALVAENAMAHGAEMTIRTDFIENEDGVDTVLVVARDDGHIIAPITKAQTYTDNDFVARARKHDDVFVQQINSSMIGVSVPVRNFSAEVGQTVTTAYAIVLYKIQTLDWGSTVALFARMLLLGLGLGFALYWLLLKIVSHPIEEASGQLDEALRGERETLKIKSKYTLFEKLLENVNSALGRMAKDNSQQQSPTVDRVFEATRTAGIISDPCFVLDNQGVFQFVNSAFEELTGMRLLTVQGQSLDVMQDQALKLSLEDLVNRARIEAGMVLSNPLEIAGLDYEIDLQAMSDGAGVACFLGVIKRGGLKL